VQEEKTSPVLFCSTHRGESLSFSAPAAAPERKSPACNNKKESLSVRVCKNTLVPYYYMKLRSARLAKKYKKAPRANNCCHHRFPTQLFDPFDEGSNFLC